MKALEERGSWGQGALEGHSSGPSAWGVGDRCRDSGGRGTSQGAKAPVRDGLEIGEAKKLWRKLRQGSPALGIWLEAAVGAVVREKGVHSAQ